MNSLNPIKSLDIQKHINLETRHKLSNNNRSPNLMHPFVPITNKLLAKVQLLFTHRCWTAPFNVHWHLTSIGTVQSYQLVLGNWLTIFGTVDQFSETDVTSLNRQVKPSFGLVYGPLPGINTGNKDTTSLVSAQAIQALWYLYQHGKDLR